MLLVRLHLSDITHTPLRFWLLSKLRVLPIHRSSRVILLRKDFTNPLEFWNLRKNGVLRTHWSPRMILLQLHPLNSPYTPLLSWIPHPKDGSSKYWDFIADGQAPLLTNYRYSLGGHQEFFYGIPAANGLGPYSLYNTHGNLLHGSHTVPFYGLGFNIVVSQT